MGFIEWAVKMRKKPLDERRGFVFVSTASIVGVVVVVWGFFFFTGISKQIEESRAYAEAKSKVPMTFNEEKPLTLPVFDF